MKPEILRKVQLAQLGIAEEIRRICDVNDIDYFLDSGSLLGAIRHRGFIPWDDDMDIGMTRENYEKFIDAASTQLKPQFFLQTWDTDQYFPYGFAKVLKKDTEYVEAVFDGTQKRNELFVDVFVYDVFPDDVADQRKQGRRLQFYRHLLMMKAGVRPWKQFNQPVKRAMTFVKYMPFMILSRIMSRSKVKERYLSSRKLFNNDSSSFLYNAGVGTYGKMVIPRSCFDEYRLVLFEKTKFLAPADSDLYLKSAYGDYMTLPPIDSRENQHGIIRLRL